MDKAAYHCMSGSDNGLKKEHLFSDEVHQKLLQCILIESSTDMLTKVCIICA